MKTDDLIKSLSVGLEPVRRGAVWRQALLWLVPAIAVAFVVMVLTLGIRPDLAAAFERPVIWIKLAFVALLTLTALFAVIDASQPLARPSRGPSRGIPSRGMIGFAAIVVITAILGALQLWYADPAIRVKTWLGGTSAECPWRIAILALPIFAGAIMAMRGFAPTNLRLAGAAAGLFAGSAAAVVYAFYCGETAIAFMATWYVAGILIVTALGALLGPRVLHW